MQNTTLCYIENDGKYLMIFRNKKKNDINEGKYIGIGGHFEEGESPYDCVIREVREETALTIKSPVYRGIVTFVSDSAESEQMHLFTAPQFYGELGECNEGELRWIDKSSLDTIPMWSGDILFLKMLDENSDFFSMKLVYEGNTLVEYHLNGQRQPFNL